MSPSAAELAEFMRTGQHDGALGASFWVWQDATADEWSALANYPWDTAASGPNRKPA